MAPSYLSRVIVATLFCSSLAVGQAVLADPVSPYSKTAAFAGNLTYDGLYNLTITIENTSERNLTIPGTNNLFDRQNSIPANTSFQLTNLAGKQVTLNGTNYQAPPLSDEVFQDIPSGGVYIRSMNLSNYLLDETAEGIALASDMTSQCFIASLPKFVYALDTTGFTGGQTLATYYLTKGLKSVPIVSTPSHFNYTVPKSFTPSQAEAIAGDATTRRIANQRASINVDRRRSRRRG